MAEKDHPQGRDLRGSGDNLASPAEDEARAGGGGDQLQASQNGVASLPPVRVRNGSGRCQEPRGGPGLMRITSLSDFRVDPNANIAPDTEDNVRNITEQVVRAFFTYSYERQETSLKGEGETQAEVDARHAALEAVRADPNVPVLSDDMIKRLRAIADEIDERYGCELERYVDVLNPTASTSYAIFAAIARRILEGGFNWGGVVVLLCFGFRMALRCLKTGLSTIVPASAYLIRFITETPLLHWIAQQGGWRALQWVVAGTHEVVKGASTTTVVAVVVVAVLSVAAAWHFSRK